MRANLAASLVLASWCAAPYAAMHFEELSTQVGIDYQGPTAGASWGDVNGDGWPDIWVGNHRFDADHPNRPVLLVNNRDGTFTEQTDRFVSIGPEADLHGSAWSDFDNDGDQDLVIIAGGGGGHGSNANLLLVNEDGRLVDRAREAGVDYPQGRGRTPLWVDADLDGRLDLVLMNTPRPDGKAPSALFLNRGDHFEAVSGRGALRIVPWRDTDMAKALWYNLTKLRFSARPPTLAAEYPFAELLDVEGDGRVEIMAFADPSRLFETGREGLEDVTLSSGLVSVPKGVRDGVIADLDGDLRYDIYIVRARPEANTISLSGGRELRATIRAPKGGEFNEISFATPGEIEVQFAPGWGQPYPDRPTVRVGDRLISPEPGRFTLQLSAESAAWDGVTGAGTTGPRGPELEIYHTGDRWIIRNAFKRLGILVLASQPISELRSKGVRESSAALKDYLLFRDGRRFRASSDFVGKDFERACHSVTAGDFDNDMDVDLYLVCTTPTRNIPNILLENDGHGRFTELGVEAGVAGTGRGRGDTAVVADYDQDGFLDLFVVNGFGPPPFTDDGPYELFHNQGNSNHWLEVDLEGERSNRDGVGAQVIVEAGGRQQIRMQNSGSHSFAQDFRRLHFGLGRFDRADRITVIWPDGSRQELKDIPADQLLTLHESPSDPE